MARVDLTVRGGGIFGLSIAWAAVRRGATVRVIETVAIGAGSSGGIVGALAPHVPDAWNAKKAFQLDSLLIAQDWWTAVAAASGLQTGYGRMGRLQPIADDAALDLAQRRVQSAQDLWRGQARWQVVRATGGDWEPLSPTGHLIHDDLSARINPRLALTALVAAIRSRGGEVVVGEAPDEGQVIWATGLAGLGDLSQAMGRRIDGGVKGQAALLGCNAAGAGQVFVGGLHIVPHGDGTVAVGSTSEATWDAADTTDDKAQDLIARARAALPVLTNAPVVGLWAGVRPRAASRAPVLGAFPGRAGQFVANGGFKIGFGMAPKVAEVMVDLVLDGRDAIPDGFRASAL